MIQPLRGRVRSVGTPESGCDLASLASTCRLASPGLRQLIGPYKS